MSHEQRQTQRRRQLIKAAIDVYGERGYRQSSVKAVCDAAGLTERYFYESFPSSEALLIETYDVVTFHMFEEIINAPGAHEKDPIKRASALLRAYFELLQREPCLARVFLLEIRGISQAADDSYNETLSELAKTVAELFDERRVKSNQLLVLGIVGGVSQIAMHWIKQGYEPSLDKVIQASIQLSRALLEQA